MNETIISLKENPLINNPSSRRFPPHTNIYTKSFPRASVCMPACLNKSLLKAREYKWPFPHWVILSARRVGWDGGGSSRDEKASWPPHKGLPVRGAMRLIIGHQTPRNSSVLSLFFFFFCNQKNEWTQDSSLWVHVKIMHRKHIARHLKRKLGWQSTCRRTRPMFGEFSKEKHILTDSPLEL